MQKPKFWNRFRGSLNMPISEQGASWHTNPKQRAPSLHKHHSQKRNTLLHRIPSTPSPRARGSLAQTAAGYTCNQKHGGIQSAGLTAPSLPHHANAEAPEHQPGLSGSLVSQLQNESGGILGGFVFSTSTHCLWVKLSYSLRKGLVSKILRLAPSDATEHTGKH